jgi:hypothetical protein
LIEQSNERHVLKNYNQSKVICAAVIMVVLLSHRTTQAEVVRTLLTFDSNVAASWQPVDFNSDGVTDISFDFYGITTLDLGGSITFFLNVVGNGNNQVLGQGNSVLSLQAETTISLTPVLGSWQNANSGPNVWTQLGSSGELIGMGAPGAGSFMGVKFETDSDWHYGWIRFGAINNPDSPLPSLPWPSVLEFGYETIAGAPIITSVPEPNAWQLLGVSILALVASRKFLNRERAAC